MALDLESSDEGDRRNLRGNNTNLNSLEGISSPDSNVLFHSSSQDSKDKVNDISTKGAHPSSSKQDKPSNVGSVVRERSSPRRMEKRSKGSSFGQLETTPRKDTLNSSFDLAHKKKSSHKKRRELIIDTMADDED